MRELALACMNAGDSCSDAEACAHDVNRMTPFEFVEWCQLQVAPPAPLRRPLSEKRQARWKRTQAAKRRVQRVAENQLCEAIA